MELHATATKSYAETWLLRFTVELPSYLDVLTGCLRVPKGRILNNNDKAYIDDVV
jgi:hypothetical protein